MLKFKIKFKSGYMISAYKSHSGGLYQYFTTYKQKKTDNTATTTIVA